jgi:hypothetical protein
VRTKCQEGAGRGVAIFRALLSVRVGDTRLRLRRLRVPAPVISTNYHDIFPGLHYMAGVPPQLKCRNSVRAFQ